MLLFGADRAGRLLPMDALGVDLTVMRAAAAIRWMEEQRGAER